MTYGSLLWSMAVFKGAWVVASWFVNDGRWWSWFMVRILDMSEQLPQGMLQQDQWLPTIGCKWLMICWELVMMRPLLADQCRSFCQFRPWPHFCRLRLPIITNTVTPAGRRSLWEPVGALRELHQLMPQREHIEHHSNDQHHHIEWIVVVGLVG